jgi:hypothetical protein
MIIHSHTKNQVNISNQSEIVVTTKYLVKLHPLCFEILTWYLVCGCIMISYRSILRFVPVHGFLAELWPLDFKFGQMFSCHHFFSLCLKILIWFLVYECIMMSYRSNLHFVPVQWSLAKLWPLDFKIWPNI